MSATFIRVPDHGATVESIDVVAHDERPLEPGQRWEVRVELGWEPEGFTMRFGGGTFGEAKAKSLATLRDLSRAVRQLKARDS